MTSDGVLYYRWADVHEDKLIGSIRRRFVHSDGLMVAQITLAKGDVVPAHRHENEQVTYVLKGVLEFTLGDEQDKVIAVAAGEVIFIPGNVLHSARTLDDCFELDIFNPPRADWIDGSDLYLRQGGSSANVISKRMMPGT
jgi:quercetin dioxygenase-like cupin family protein